MIQPIIHTYQLNPKSQRCGQNQLLIHLVALHVLRALHLCASGFILVACTEAGVVRCTDTEQSGYLFIYPDNSEYTLPALSYHFYNMDGRTECLTAACDGRGNFEGRIPAGTYRVIAVNTNAANITFTGLDRCETAMATDQSVSTRSVHSAGLPSVYTVVLGDFDVVPSDTLHHAPLPELLTRHVRIRFLLGPNLLPLVSGIKGTLGGVYPSVRLFSGELHHDNIQNISLATIEFIADSKQQEWSAMVSVFGICDPAYGAAYTSTLNLTLTLTDGREVSAQADLTNQLSEIIDQSGGVIPISLELEMEIEPDEAGFTINIVGWEADGGDEAEIF